LKHKLYSKFDNASGLRLLAVVGALQIFEGSIARIAENVVTGADCARRLPVTA